MQNVTERLYSLYAWLVLLIKCQNRHTHTTVVLLLTNVTNSNPHLSSTLQLGFLQHHNCLQLNSILQQKHNNKILLQTGHILTVGTRWNSSYNDYKHTRQCHCKSVSSRLTLFHLMYILPSERHTQHTHWQQTVAWHILEISIHRHSTSKTKWPHQVTLSLLLYSWIIITNEK